MAALTGDTSGVGRVDWIRRLAGAVHDLIVLLRSRIAIEQGSQSTEERIV